MRVIRMNHKTGLAVVIILGVTTLLWLIHSKIYSIENIENDNFPTRSVDFVDIGRQIKTPEFTVTRTVEQTSSKIIGKSMARGKKKPQPPKKLISDGGMMRNVVKAEVHGDNENGGIKRDANKGNKHFVKPDKVKPKVTEISDKSNKPSTTKIAVLVIACNRPEAIKRCLDGLLKYRPSAEQFPIVVSQDCGHDATAEAIGNYGNQVKHIKQPDLSSVSLPANMRHFQGYYKIARHYEWALSQMFDELAYDTVLIVEDDLDIAPDFYDYFTKTRPLLDVDPTIWCVSAWNDNGKEGMIETDRNDLLYRSDFFPGLGWMLKKSLWNELKAKWPVGFWDDWMREVGQRKDRVCIRPEISRTRTFGKTGVSQGQFFEQHLKYIVLNQKKFDFAHEDLSYLLKKNYDRIFLGKVLSLPVLTVQDILDKRTKEHKAVRINYPGEYEFNSIASKLGVMKEFKAGVPRTGYHGVVTMIRNGVRIFITPNDLSMKN